MKIITEDADLLCLTNADAEVASTAYPIRVIHIARRKVRILMAMPTISDCERWKSLGYKNGNTKHTGVISVCDDWRLAFRHEKAKGEDILKLLEMRRESDDAQY